MMTNFDLWKVMTNYFVVLGISTNDLFLGQIYVSTSKRIFVQKMAQIL
jgi:hypothetical protein